MNLLRNSLTFVKEAYKEHKLKLNVVLRFGLTLLDLFYASAYFERLKWTFLIL